MASPEISFNKVSSFMAEITASPRSSFYIMKKNESTLVSLKCHENTLG